MARLDGGVQTSVKRRAIDTLRGVARLYVDPLRTVESRCGAVTLG
jgi:hypothetical protein